MLSLTAPRRVLLSLSFALLAAAPAAAEVRSGSTVVIAADERIDGNLYVSAGNVTVRGDIDGDLIAAGGTVLVDGHVSGDVLAAGGEVTIGGVVDGDIRAAGATLAVLSRVHGDVVAAGGDVELASTVGGDVFVSGNTVSVRGDVAGDLALAMGDASLAGVVTGDVDATGGRMRLKEGAVVGGHVAFTGESLERGAGVVVAGSVVERAPPSSAGMSFVRWLQALVGICIFGALWFTLFRGFAGRAMDTLGARPGSSFGLGFLVLLASPVIIAVVLAVGVVIGGWWISLVGAAVYFTAIAVASPLVAAFVGRRFLLRRGDAAPPSVSRERWAMLAVLVLLSIATAVPFVGGLLGFAVVLFGLGAIAMTALPTPRSAAQRASPTPAPSTSASPLPLPVPSAA
jgi:cytoskeletal protein CcmA (bactofilin family)